MVLPITTINRILYSKIAVIISYLCFSPPPEPRGDFEPPEPRAPTLVAEGDLYELKFEKDEGFAA